MRLGLMQIDVKLGQPQDNLEGVLQKLSILAAQGCDLVVLPELWDVGFDYDNFEQYKQLAGQSLSALAEGAKTYNLNIHGGSILHCEQSDFYNRSYLINRLGEPVVSYDKLHLFGLMDETDYLTAGNRVVVAELDQVKFGLAICYDLRFPELFRRLAQNGAQVICVPGQWPSVRKEHWLTLLKARAIENQVFVVGVNRVGTTDATVFGGHSLVVDPWGEVVVAGGLAEELLVCDLDVNQVEQVRKKMSCWQDRRVDIYG